MRDIYLASRKEGETGVKTKFIFRDLILGQNPDKMTPASTLGSEIQTPWADT